MIKQIKNSYWLLMLLLIVLSNNQLAAQNTIITDDDGQNAHNSAMLDVYSTSKGFLAPRMTTAQRVAIATPAEGLMVYDIDANAFYMYGETGWTYLDKPLVWQTNNDSVYVIGSGKKYGVGTSSPLAKLTVQGDAGIPADEALFEVKNSAGDVIFAVYENEVQVNFRESAKGVKGGFAVGGLSGTKATPTEYMRITPDSVRIYIDDTPAKGVKGGFAVGGLSGTKGGNQYFKLDDESASIYLKQPAKGVKGGFAVGGLSGTKGSEDYLTIERDSARMYINDAAKGVKGGFAVGGLSGIKAGNNFLDLTPDNYFIGQGAGSNTQPNGVPLQGKFNQFFGYEAGLNNVIGLYNILIGYQAGFTSTEGNYNTFMGYQAGLTNTGSDNTFIGFKAGSSHLGKGGNVYIGSKAGELATEGEQNVFIGESSGQNTITGNKNIFIGFESGLLNQGGLRNVFIGDQAGSSNTSGNLNTFVGAEAGAKSISTNYSTFIGHRAGFSSTEGYNTAVGYNSAASGITGSNKAFLGYSAGSTSSGDDNTYLGAEAGYYSYAGAKNVFVGTVSGRVATGSRNVFVGYGTGYSAAAGSDNIFIGYGIGWSETNSNRLIIGNQNRQTFIYGDMLNQTLAIDATVTANSYNTISLEAGEEVNASATGTSNMIPIAYGVINTDGSVLSGSGNFTSAWNGTYNRYEITISGVSYLYTTFTTVITCLSNPRMASTGSVGGKLLVEIYNPDGSADTTGERFSFIVYKP